MGFDAAYFLTAQRNPNGAVIVEMIKAHMTTADVDARGATVGDFLGNHVADVIAGQAAADVAVQPAIMQAWKQSRDCSSWSSADL